MVPMFATYRYYQSAHVQHKYCRDRTLDPLRIVINLIRAASVELLH